MKIKISNIRYKQYTDSNGRKKTICIADNKNYWEVNAVVTALNILENNAYPGGLKSKEFFVPKSFKGEVTLKEGDNDNYGSACKEARRAMYNKLTKFENKINNYILTDLNTINEEILSK